MCGRVRLSSDVSEIKLVFSIPPPTDPRVLCVSRPSSLPTGRGKHGPQLAADRRFFPEPRRRRVESASTG